MVTKDRARRQWGREKPGTRGFRDRGNQELGGTRRGELGTGETEGGAGEAGEVADAGERWQQKSELGDSGVKARKAEKQQRQTGGQQVGELGKKWRGPGS